MKQLIVPLALAASILSYPVFAHDEDQTHYNGPIIDMHFHGPLAEGWGPPFELWLEKLDRLNVNKVVLAAYPEQLAEWVQKAPDMLVPSLMFPCLTQALDNCFSDDTAFPDVDWVRTEIQEGRIRMLGEVITQLYGIAPGDLSLAPYFALAAEFDIPFGLHMGPGPAWAVSTDSIYTRFPDFEISAGNPLELEAVLRQHPNLRLYIMHAGWPMTDELLSVLWHNPNVYVELGHLQDAISRPAYYEHLRLIFEAGFGDRVMYGSDVGIEIMGEGIRAILEADFLSPNQKRDVLYNNAARFLRLSEEEIARHHSR